MQPLIIFSLHHMSLSDQYQYILLLRPTKIINYLLKDCKILIFLKMCQIFVDSVNNFGSSDANMIIYV